MGAFRGALVSNQTVGIGAINHVQPLAAATSSADLLPPTQLGLGGIQTPVPALPVTPPTSRPTYATVLRTGVEVSAQVVGRGGSQVDGAGPFQEVKEAAREAVRRG